MSTTVEICSLCEGSGLRVAVENGRSMARECECRASRRAARALQKARIPKRYEHCSLDNYEHGFAGADKSLWAAHMRARKFVEGYPIETGDTGLLFVGSVGVGKTHLAVGILRGLINERGASGIFCDYRDLLKQVQDSYNPSVAATEMQILRPVFEAEILVLDELGASKPTEWVWDTVAHILNTRYNERRPTIITTNFADAAPLGLGVPFDEIPAASEPDTEAGKAARAAMRKETLGDRIGERMRSRLHEMCVSVEVYGADFRTGVKGATFAPKAPPPVSIQSAVEALKSATEVLRAMTGTGAPADSGLPKDPISELPASAPLQQGHTAQLPVEEEKPIVGADRMGRWAAKNRRRELDSDSVGK